MEASSTTHLENSEAAAPQHHKDKSSQEEIQSRRKLRGSQFLAIDLDEAFPHDPQQTRTTTHRSVRRRTPVTVRPNKLARGDPAQLGHSCLLIPVFIAAWWYWTRKVCRKVVRRLIRSAPEPETRSPETFEEFGYRFEENDSGCENIEIDSSTRMVRWINIDRKAQTQAKMQRLRNVTRNLLSETESIDESSGRGQLAESIMADDKHVDEYISRDGRPAIETNLSSRQAWESIPDPER